MQKVIRPAACLMSVLFTTAVMADGAKAAKGPVKIFLLSGQSNMTGRGTLGDLNKPAADQKATLVRYIKDPNNVEKYKFLYSGPKKTPSGWTVRDDVFITLGDWPHDGSAYKKHGGLAPYYGSINNAGFGPELGIGNALGDYYDEPVLLVKVSFGANSLAVNFRSPSSGGKLGDKYPLVVKAVRDAIEHLPGIVPGYDKKQGYEIVGFLWNQGLNDMTDKYAGEYETNLANLIKDLRKEFKTPDMKVVVAVTGNYGRKEDISPAQRKVIEAQLAISRRLEFKATVATAETRDFYRPQGQYGGNKQWYHWHGNGESYWLIGEAMGREMVKLLGAKK